MKSHNPIGVFDSGLGGLTVMKELMRQLPQEDIVYFGDTARVPYGTKSKESIVRFSKENTQILLKYRVKVVVVACNSSTSYALPILTKIFPIPILGVIKPGAKKALQATRNNRVGVIATTATINSKEYTKMIHKFNPRVKVFGHACPLFVPLVEEGWLNKKVTLSIARNYLTHLKRVNVDTLILGCTHYPLLKKVLKKVMGKKVKLIDSAQEVAKEVKEFLEKNKMKKEGRGKGKYKLFVSDEPQRFKQIARNFLGFDISHIERHS